MVQDLVLIPKDNYIQLLNEAQTNREHQEQEQEEQQQSDGRSKTVDNISTHLDKIANNQKRNCHIVKTRHVKDTQIKIPKKVKKLKWCPY